MKKCFRNLTLAMLLLLGVMTALIKPHHAYGQNGQERPDVALSNVKVTNEKGAPTDTVLWWETFHVSLDWDASQYKDGLKAGDYFDITLPDVLTLRNDHSVRNFDLLAEDGTVVARAVVTTPHGNGGTIRVTFTDYVENRTEVKGTLHIMTQLTRGITQLDGDNKLDFTTGGSAADGGVHVVGPVDLQDEVVKKWAFNTDGQTVTWRVRLNHAKQSHVNVKISDQLTTDNGNLDGIHYIAGSFVLYEVTYDSKGDEISRVTPGKDINSDVILSQDGASFEYPMGTIDGKQYLLEYQSTYRSGLRLNNTVHVSGDALDRWGYSYHESTVGGGTGQGHLAGQVTVVKVDENDPTKRLAGARFLLENQATKETFEATTNDEGVAVFAALPVGTYLGKEIVAPTGYVLNQEVKQIELTNNQLAASITFTNKVETVSVSVKKVWEGKQLDSVEVVLFADRKERDVVTLSAANQWGHVFENLPKYDENGHEISYTVEEKLIAGYDASVVGDVANGFVITNREVPTTPPGGGDTDPSPDPNPQPQPNPTPDPQPTPDPGMPTPPKTPDTTNPPATNPPASNPPADVPGSTTNPTPPVRISGPGLPNTGEHTEQLYLFAGTFLVAGFALLFVDKKRKEA